MCDLVHYNDMMKKTQMRSANSIWDLLERKILCSRFISAECPLTFYGQPKILSVKLNKWTLT